ncbi:hypothetical protein KKA00_00040 [bacterium]|nr:hypothetical protein [bacterium]MBU1650579.1 hypothetical protein [bacterium]MBU1882019.1 hypothetical protein [bacterium]
MKISKYLLPVLVIFTLFGGYALRHAFTKPTTQVTFEGNGTETTTYVVEGLKCKGTANYFTSLYKDKAGISSIETFATEHLAVFTYDSEIITADDIQAIMDASLPMKDGSHRQVFRCVERR